MAGHWPSWAAQTLVSGADAVRALDCDPIIDSVPALVALACLTPGETRFLNGANLRAKESDRIGDLCAELTRAGADVTELADGIITRGRPEGIAGRCDSSRARRSPAGAGAGDRGHPQPRRSDYRGRGCGR